MIKVQSTNISEAIKLLRESKGMTRAELSEAAGISESHLKKIETGAGIRESIPIRRLFQYWGWRLLYRMKTIL